MKLLQFATAYSSLHEAKVSVSHVNLALSKMVHFIQRKMEHKLVRIPGIEHFKNSQGTGYGHRYVFNGTAKCIRFNWNHARPSESSSEIVSIDIFSGKSKDPSFRIETKGISFASILPTLVAILRSPSLGKFKVFPVSATEAISEAVIMEVARDAFTSESALTDFLEHLKNGKTFTRSEFIQSYHIVHAGIFDVIFKDFKDDFKIDAKRISFKEDSDVTALKNKILGSSAIVSVTRGPTSETYLETQQESEAEQVEKVSFSDSLDHLEGLVSGIVAGAFNALFVAGAGGTGKTQTVERVLGQHGLSDGAGYFKNTGSASPIGIYTLLYKQRDGIIVFDDSDGALQDQDARNLIKAATDTKKHRKLVWNKKSFSMYDPEHEDADQYAEDSDKIPKHFEFSGRIIFISNLSLNKLDPDGALRTRAFIINIDPTQDELFEHMGKILHHIKLEDGLSLSSSEREHVLEVVKASKRKDGVSLRKLVRALNLAASGIQNWKTLVDLYC